MKYSKTNMLLALSFASVMVASCHKDDDNNGSAGPNPPGFNLTNVAPPDFKNTAVGTAPIAAVFNKVATSTESANLTGSRNYPHSTNLTNKDVLNSARVNSFLSSSDFPSSGTTFPSLSLPRGEDVKEGGDCSSINSLISSVFEGAASGLRYTATSLEQFKGELPAGMTRGAPTEQFAVTYTIDLSQMKVSASDHPQTKTPIPDDSGPVVSFPDGPHALVSIPTRPGPGHNGGTGDDSNHGTSPDAVTTSGLVIIGAGANTDMAVLAMGMDASGSSKSGSGTVRAGFAASANQKDKVLKVNLNGNENMTQNAEGTNQTQNIHGTQNVDLTLQAGEKPFIDLGVSGTINGQPVEGGTLNLTAEDHTIAATVRVEAAENNGIKVTYSYTEDAKKTDGKLTMVTDENGQCVVKDSIMTGPSSLAAR